MAGEFSTAGIKVYYAKASTISNTPPSGSYTQLPGIKSTPDFNSEPSTLEVTDLSDPVYKRYIPGLKDLGGASAFTANLTTAFKTAWASLCTEAESVKDGTGEIWFEIAIPDFESFYFTGTPTPLGLGALEVDSVMEIDAYVTPNKVVGWAAAKANASI